MNSQAEKKLRKRNKRKGCWGEKRATQKRRVGGDYYKGPKGLSGKEGKHQLEQFKLILRTCGEKKDNLKGRGALVQLERGENPASC